MFAQLSHIAGSLTVGAPEPDLPPTGGILNVYPGSLLLFPTGPAGTFVVKSLGEINMHGGFGFPAVDADITMLRTSLDIRPAEGAPTPGKLNALNNTDNAITGDVANAGEMNIGQSGGSGAGLAVFGVLTVTGTLEMYGSTLSAAQLTLSGGTLTTHNGIDSIIILGGGTFTNNGTIDFTGDLHTLTVTGDYVQGGTLKIRLANGGNDS